MFRCELCGKVSNPREKQYKKTIQTRNKTYTYLDNRGRCRTSKGEEIVKEINVCEKCNDRK